MLALNPRGRGKRAAPGSRSMPKAFTTHEMVR